MRSMNTITSIFLPTTKSTNKDNKSENVILEHLDFTFMRDSNLVFFYAFNDSNTKQCHIIFDKKNYKQDEKEGDLDMKGTLSHELEISLPADEIWSVYRGLELAELVVKLLPNVIYKMDIVEGDGGVGTILHLYFPPGTPLVQSYKEKFTKIDDEKHIKETHVVQGGYLELGFISYMVKFEVIRESEADSIVKSTIEYEVDEEFASNASLISTAPLAMIHETVGKYLIEKKFNA